MNKDKGMTLPKKIRINMLINNSATSEEQFHSASMLSKKGKVKRLQAVNLYPPKMVKAHLNSWHSSRILSLEVAKAIISKGNSYMI